VCGASKIPKRQGFACFEMNGTNESHEEK